MKANLTERPVRVGLISLGCAKNLVDAEIMLGSLLKEGIEITNDAAQADVVIVNTCSFIDAAQEESVDTILQSAELREAKSRGQGLIVSGCLPQRFRDELPKLLPEVDAFMGIDQVAQVTEIVHEALQRRRERVAEGRPKSKVQSPKSRIIRHFAKLERTGVASGVSPDIEGGILTPGLALQTLQPHAISMPLPPGKKPGSRAGGRPAARSPLIAVNRRPNYIPDFATPRFRLTPKHFAYLKIAEGCNHPCSFCIIPRMRGAHRSRHQSDVVQEARQLIAEGVKELNLISQDSTYYGLDLRQNHRPNIASPEKFSATAQSLSANSTTLCTLLREL